MTTNDKGFTKSAARRIDELCAGHTNAPDYFANVRTAKASVLENLKRMQK